MNLDETGGQYVRTEDLVTDIPRWVGALAILQCVRAGVHDLDYMGERRQHLACRKHILEAWLRAAWLTGDIDEPTALVVKVPRDLR